MHSLARIVLASATLLSIATASVIEKRGAFSVKQKLNTNFVPNGPAAYAKTFLKYNKPLPRDFQHGKVTATPGDAYDTEYVCPVDIDGQTLSLDFDTGSTDFWLFSPSLPTSDQTNHTLFDPTKSKNWKPLEGYTFNKTYGDGSFTSGFVGTDVVTVGGVTVANQPIDIATSVSSSFVAEALDGLFGLAFVGRSTVKPVPQKSFFETAMLSLFLPVFTVDLKYHAPGTYDFGMIDPFKYTGEITYTKVNTSQGFWAFYGSGYAVGNGSFQPLIIDAIADTGTTLIFAPDEVVTAYYNEVSGASYDSTQGGYTFPCLATLPSLTLGIGSHMAVIPGEYMNSNPVGDSKCFGGVQSSNGIGFSVYGDVFFKSQFIVFDGSTPPLLGFAAKAIW